MPEKISDGKPCKNHCFIAALNIKYYTNALCPKSTRQKYRVLLYRYHYLPNMFIFISMLPATRYA